MRAPCAAVLAALALAAPGSAFAQEPDARLSEQAAIRIADREPAVAEQRAEHPRLTTSAELENGDWKVHYHAGSSEEAQVLVDDATGVVRESWTGYQVAWKMARGYEGTFGHKLNAPYVFIPLCALFLIGLVDWRRPFRVAHLDLLVLLSFAASNFFFNRGEIGISVPLQYPPLLYLLGRCLWIGFKGRGEGIRPVWPARWLLIATLFLVGFRGGLNIADSGVIDVGYASVVGADRISHAETLYGSFPEDVAKGDTYGPVNYLAYVPFELALPFAGEWDDLPAAHAGAIFFDLAAIALLIVLGRRLRPGAAGTTLGATLAFGWAAYPYTAFTLMANSNDTLVGLLLIGCLLALARPAARGALLALAVMTKFAPLVLAPMMATRRLARAEVARFAAGFCALLVLLMVPVAIDPGIGTFWEHTFGYQSGRDSPFSVWGQAEALEPLRLAILAATGILAVVVAFRPREPSAVQVAALAAALLIGVQLAAHHWFYLYLVWFFPLVLVAICAVTPEPASGSARSIGPGHRAEPRPARPSPRRLRRRSRSEPASV